MKFGFDYCVNVDISSYRLQDCSVDRIILDIEGQFVILIPAAREGRTIVYHYYYSICDDENFDSGWIRDLSKDFALMQCDLYVSYEQGEWVPAAHKHYVIGAHGDKTKAISDKVK